MGGTPKSYDVVEEISNLPIVFAGNNKKFANSEARRLNAEALRLGHKHAGVDVRYAVVERDSTYHELVELDLDPDEVLNG